MGNETPKRKTTRMQKKNKTVRHYSEAVKTQMIYYKGIRYDIPVDENGKVPILAMVQHYQAMGNSTKDKNSNSPIIYPNDATPRDIIQWWANPASCDIDGIDTKDSPIYDVSSVKGKRMKEVQKRIGIITPSPKKAKELRKIIADSFTADELDLMTKNESFIIVTQEDCGNTTGYYLRKQTGVEVPLIVVEQEFTPDGVVHEIVHHARTTRKDGKVSRVAFPTKSDGSLNETVFNSMSKEQRDRIVDAEESATVAETLVRTKRDRQQTGYYDSIGGRQSYLRDDRVIGKNKPDMTLKGAAAIKRTEEQYGDLEIAKAKIMSSTPAKESLEKVSIQQAAIQQNQKSTKKKKTTKRKTTKRK